MEGLGLDLIGRTRAVLLVHNVQLELLVQETLGFAQRIDILFAAVWIEAEVNQLQDTLQEFRCICLLVQIKFLGVLYCVIVFEQFSPEIFRVQAGVIRLDQVSLRLG